MRINKGYICSPTMRLFFGPYYRADKNDKWHWRKECPHFPFDSDNSLISSDVPELPLLCLICASIEKQEPDGVRLKKHHQYL
jgi:hypothetical protein